MEVVQRNCVFVALLAHDCPRKVLGDSQVTATATHHSEVEVAERCCTTLPCPVGMEKLGERGWRIIKQQHDVARRDTCT
jgi:hypothetical protein